MSRRAFRLTPVEPRERDIQDAILRYLAVDRRVAWAKRFNTGAHVVEGRDKQGKPKRLASSKLPRVHAASSAIPGCMISFAWG
ncbi:hypothetical protein [Thiorhodococcus minor]|uniref:Uncharacterized protein n=1 Tax=Thiorhodococcus minor TaxID=57489 RepID=A0A6M0JWR3_9GAMM|nr:hypothetical protein [Thiorhodococcus minor]NEV61524.1 hypothetical protein [Thiorhodococcus minor]